jgi:hypothetical protein
VGDVVPTDTDIHSLQVLLPSRTALSWCAPSVCGLAQARQSASPLQCLSRMKQCGIPLTYSDNVPVTVGFLAQDKIGVPPTAPAWIVEGHDEFDVRVWTGEVRETRGHIRPEGVGLG